VFIKFFGTHAEYNRIDVETALAIRPIRSKADHRAAMARITEHRAIRQKPRVIIKSLFCRYPGRS
jgi:hypothetical protein